MATNQKVSSKTERNWRWTCPHCKAEGWEVISKQGQIPTHDRPDGRACQKHLAAKAAESPTFTDTCVEHAYGSAYRLPFQIRVF